MKQPYIHSYILLHVMLMIYSVSGILSKLAACQPFPSNLFFMYYLFSLFCLGIYAICWQQVIKRLPLSLAFSSKGVTVVWGMLWGSLVFREQITLKMFLGAACIILGVAVFALSEGDQGI